MPSTDQRSSLASDLTRCADCGSPQSLWICLICGHAGCKDDGLNHALLHYKDTSHPYALEIETQRVWDYVGDGYANYSNHGKLVADLSLKAMSIG